MSVAATKESTEADHSGGATKKFGIPEDNAALGREITRLAGRINTYEYRFLKLVDAMVLRESWRDGSGMKSPAHWLNYHCGLAMGVAREKIRVAGCLRKLPRIDEAFGKGDLSYSKVRALTRSASPAREQFLLQIARNSTAEQVEQVIRRYEKQERLDSPQRDKELYEARKLAYYFDEDGMFVFYGRLTPEDGASFLRVMQEMLWEQEKERREPRAAQEERLKEESCAGAGEDSGAAGEGDETMQCEGPDGSAGDMTASDEIRRASLGEDRGENVPAGTFLGEPEEPSYDQKRADALMLMAEHVLSGRQKPLNPLSGAERYQVVVHIEEDKLSDSGTPASARCFLEGGPVDFAISSHLVRRLTCDSTLVPVLQDEKGKVLSVGRKSRVVPSHIRRALLERDQGCRFPGCCQRRFVDAHHIKHWTDGGETSLDNLVLLCRHHHRLIHMGGFKLIRNQAGQMEFISPDGEYIPFALSRQFDTLSQERRGIEI